MQDSTNWFNLVKDTVMSKVVQDGIGELLQTNFNEWGQSSNSSSVPSTLQQYDTQYIMRDGVLTPILRVTQTHDFGHGGKIDNYEESGVDQKELCKSINKVVDKFKEQQAIRRLQHQSNQQMGVVYNETQILTRRGIDGGEHNASKVETLKGKENNSKPRHVIDEHAHSISQLILKDSSGKKDDKSEKQETKKDESKSIRQTLEAKVDKYNSNEQSRYKTKAITIPFMVVGGLALIVGILFLPPVAAAIGLPIVSSVVGMGLTAGGVLTAATASTGLIVKVSDANENEKQIGEEVKEDIGKIKGNRESVLAGIKGKSIMVKKFFAEHPELEKEFVQEAKTVIG